VETRPHATTARHTLRKEIHSNSGKRNKYLLLKGERIFIRQAHIVHNTPGTQPLVRSRPKRRLLLIAGNGENPRKHDRFCPTHAKKKLLPDHISSSPTFTQIAHDKALRVSLEGHGKHP